LFVPVERALFLLVLCTGKYIFGTSVNTLFHKITLRHTTATSSSSSSSYHHLLVHNRSRVVHDATRNRVYVFPGGELYYYYGPIFSVWRNATTITRGTVRENENPSSSPRYLLLLRTKSRNRHAPPDWKRANHFAFSGRNSAFYSAVVFVTPARKTKTISRRGHIIIVFVLTKRSNTRFVNIKKRNILFLRFIRYARGILNILSSIFSKTKNLPTI